MQSIKKLCALIGAVALLGASAVQAAVPTGVQTIFTDLATDFGVVVGYGWILFLVVVGGLALFGIVKKIFHKAT